MGVNNQRSDGDQPTSNNGSDSSCSCYRCFGCCPEKRGKVAPSKRTDTITEQPVGTNVDKPKGQSFSEPYARDNNHHQPRNYGALTRTEPRRENVLIDNQPTYNNTAVIYKQPGIEEPITGTLGIDQSSGTPRQSNQSIDLENPANVIAIEDRSSTRTSHEPETVNSKENITKIGVDGTTVAQIESVPPSPAPEISPAASTDNGSVIRDNNNDKIGIPKQQESPTEKTSTVSNSYDVNPSVPSSPTGSELNNTTNDTTEHSSVQQSDQSSDNVVQHPATLPVVIEPIEGGSLQDPSPLLPLEKQGVSPQNPVAITDGLSQQNAEASASFKRSKGDGPKKIIKKEEPEIKRKKPSSDKTLPKSTEPKFKEGDKIVLLLGETGVGKSTFVNSILNYLISPTLEEAKNSKAKILIPTRVDRYNEDYVEQEPYFFPQNHGKHIVYNEEVKKGQSLTQEARHYTLKYGPDKRLVLIDTAGIGDTRGIEYDKTNLEQLKGYLYEKGIRQVHGICILLHPNYKHLTAGLKYTLHSTIDFFGPSSFDNIFFCFTRTASTSYKPGDTLSALRQFLQNNTKYSKTLTTTPKNVFCFENSCFREKLLMEKSPEQTDQFILERASESWKISAKNMNKLIEELETREKPFQIPDDWFETTIIHL